MKYCFEINGFMTYSEVVRRIHKHEGCVVSGLRIDMRYIEYTLINNNEKYYVTINLVEGVSDTYPKVESINIVCNNEDFIEEFKGVWL